MSQGLQGLPCSLAESSCSFMIPSPGVLMKGIVTELFMTGCPSWRQPHAWDAASNSSKH